MSSLAHRHNVNIKWYIKLHLRSIADEYTYKHIYQHNVHIDGMSRMVTHIQHLFYTGTKTQHNIIYDITQIRGVH